MAKVAAVSTIWTGSGREHDQLTNRDDTSVVLGRAGRDIAHLIVQPNCAAFHDPLARATLGRFLNPTGSRGVCHGPVHPAVRRLAGLRLPLLRPHRHIRLPQRAVATRAGGELLPSSRWRSRGEQGDPEPAHRRLSELGGSLRTQSWHPDRVGRKGGPQGKPCPAVATSHGAGGELRRLLHPQEHGAGADLSRHRAKIPNQGCQLSHPEASAQPLHPLLFLHPRRNPRPMGMRVASFLPFQTTYYLNGHSFIEQELNRARIGFRKIDNAFLAVDDVAALQAAADRLSPEIIRQRLDYWTLILGPKFSAKERTRLNLSRFYAIAQIEYCRNFIFKRHFPIHKLLERSCELGLWRLTGDKIAAIFGTRVNRRMRGKLATIIDRAEHGHHVFRAYFKHAFLKQYEKFATYLRNELVSNNLADFHLRKGLDHLHAVRERFQTITDRFAGFQAQWLNVHVDFPLLQRLALPITIGAVRYPGIKLHDPRVIRLFEVLLHGGSHVGGWTAKQIHQAVLGTFQLSDTRYAINQLRYDLRKLKGH